MAGLYLRRPQEACCSELAVPLGVDLVLEPPVRDCVLTKGEPVALLMLLVWLDSVVILPDPVIHILAVFSLWSPACHAILFGPWAWKHMQVHSASTHMLWV